MFYIHQQILNGINKSITVEVCLKTKIIYRFISACSAVDCKRLEIELWHTTMLQSGLVLSQSVQRVSRCILFIYMLPV